MVKVWKFASAMIGQTVSYHMHGRYEMPVEEILYLCSRGPLK